MQNIAYRNHTGNRHTSYCEKSQQIYRTFTFDKRIKINFALIGRLCCKFWQIEPLLTKICAKNDFYEAVL